MLHLRSSCRQTSQLPWLTNKSRRTRLLTLWYRILRSNEWNLTWIVILSRAQANPCLVGAKNPTSQCWSTNFSQKRLLASWRYYWRNTPTWTSLLQIWNQGCCHNWKQSHHACRTWRTWTKRRVRESHCPNQSLQCATFLESRTRKNQTIGIPCWQNSNSKSHSLGEELKLGSISHQLNRVMVRFYR